MKSSQRYLIAGAPRAQLADALLEYRTFADENPGDPLSEDLLRVVRDVRLALREERRIARAIGEPAKVNAHIALSPRDRRQMQRRRRERLAATRRQAEAAA